MRIISTENDSINNPSLTTPFIIIHIISGIWLTSLIKTYFPKYKNVLLIVLIIHTIYEIKDIYVSYYLKYNNVLTNNSWLNSIGDTIGAIIGYYLYNLFPIKFKWATIIYLLSSIIAWQPHIKKFIN